MQIRQLLMSTLFLGLSIPTLAEPPAEVVSSCTQQKAVRPSVVFSNLTLPKFDSNVESGCEQHFERSIDGLTYGGILCDNKGYIILNNQRIKLSDAINFSVNPTIKPGAVGDSMDLDSRWSKIEFANNTYLCIASALGPIGDGAAASQYYIVENPYASISSLYYYFYVQDIMPITSYSD